MSYWNEVKDVFLKGVDLAADGIKEGANLVFEKGKEGIQYSQLKKDLFMEHRKLNNVLTEIGDTTSVLYRERKDLYADMKLKELIDRLGTIENACKAIEGKIASIGQERKAG